MLQDKEPNNIKAHKYKKKSAKGKKTGLKTKYVEKEEKLFTKN